MRQQIVTCARAYERAFENYKEAIRNYGENKSTENRVAAYQAQNDFKTLELLLAKKVFYKAIRYKYLQIDGVIYSANSETQLNVIRPSSIRKLTSK